VNPGFGGQKFIPNTLNKIKDLHCMILEKGCSTDIEVDGGISLSNAEKVIKAGANVLVAGTAVYKGNIEKNVKGFQEVFARVK